MSDLPDLFPGFAVASVATAAGDIHARVGGAGPPLLLLHGYPQTHVMWHRLVPALAQHFRLVLADLPGYGQSAAPPPAAGHWPYDKRASAAAMIEAMAKLGFPRFHLAGHDRGGRVGYRLALDHPNCVIRLALLDIVPTFAMWHGMDQHLAMRAWHWMFLAQPPPLPETLISQAPTAYQDWLMASWTKTKDLSAFDPQAREHYHAFFVRPERIRATCEDYRAGQTVDLAADEVDYQRGHKLTCPVLALWGTAGIPDTSGPLLIWRQWASHLTGLAVESGHFLTEENPRDTAAALLEFFR